MRITLPLLGIAILFAGSVSATVREIAVPDTAAYPEGIAYDASSGSLYAGSAVDGALLRIDAKSGKAVQIVKPGLIAPDGSRFPAMLGMKLDDKGRLWIAGGRTGLVTVVDPANGNILAQRSAPSTADTLLNDLIFVGNSAYVTDTFVPMLWKISHEGDTIGQVEPWLDLRGTPIAFADGPNLNGITATKDGRFLIVDQMNKGALFRIDLATKAITPIDIGGETLTGSDGLTLDGHMLYLDRQWSNEIVTIRMDADFARGKVIHRFKEARLRYPADSVAVGHSLIITNAQFDHHDDNTAPVRPFSLIAIPMKALVAKP